MVFLFLGVLVMTPALMAAAEEQVVPIFRKPVPPELSKRIETGIKNIESKHPLDLASRRSLVLAFAVRANSKNERIYFDPDPNDVAFLAEDLEKFLVREISHTALANMQFRAVGAGALPYLARKLAAEDVKTRQGEFFVEASYESTNKSRG